MKDYDDSDDDFGKLSKINSAGLINTTLSNLWQDFFRHFRHGEFLNANSDLDCVWTILGGEKDIEGGDTEKEFLKIEKELSVSGSLQNSLNVKGFGSVDSQQLLNMRKQKGLLLRKALFLRRLQNTQGMGKAYVDEDEGDF